ncbi:MAG TPA: dTDP-4-dehydrorhamnose 3,5-epimerase [Terriglobia bacterium]|nr:dTDP-4-dehydrorhamnose 3,5-epimerase [Terriglobia bacterium]
MPFRFRKTGIDGVMLIEPDVFADNRGFFMEAYKESDFVAAGLAERFVQENHSRSKARILRGLHYQVPPRAQAKLVRVIAGEIFDVAVDIRAESSTFSKWVGYNLSAENRLSLFIPPWCAHGFCVLSSEAEVLYKTTDEYAPGLERGLLWSDPTINIHWPVQNPILSDRDRAWPPLTRTVVSPFQKRGEGLPKVMKGTL